MAQFEIYNADFESSNQGWSSTQVLIPSEEWNLTNTSFPGNNTGHWATSPYPIYNNNMRLIVQSPSLNLTGQTNMTFSIDIRFNTEAGYDGAQVEYSVGGGTWTDLGARNRGTNWYNDNDVDAIANRAPGWSNNNSQWTTATIPLPNAVQNQPDVRFRVLFASDFSVQDQGFAFDNIAITNSAGTVYSEDFNTGGAGWGNVIESSNSSWVRDNASFNGNTSNHWRINPFNDYANNTDIAVVSPAFDFGPYSALTVEFRLRYQTEADWDGLRVEYSTDLSNWLPLGVVNDPNGTNWFNDTDVDAITDLADGWSGNNGSWQTSSLALPELFNHLPVVYFRLRFASDASIADNGVAFDDFKILVDGYQTISDGTFTSNSTWDGNVVPPTGSIFYVGEGLDLSINTNVGAQTVYLLPNSTLDLGTHTLSISESLEVQNGASLTGNGTIDYSKSGNQNIAPLPYYNLTLSGSGDKTITGSTSISRDLLLKNTGVNLISNNNLTLQSTASGTGRLLEIPSGASFVGDLTQQRYVGANQRSWWHLSSPFTNASAADWQNNFQISGEFAGADDVGGSNFASIKWYDETKIDPSIDSGWVDFPAANTSEIIEIGRGYRAFLRTDGSTVLGNTTISMNGTPNTGNVNLDVSYSTTGASDAAVAGWSFVGNPYPCDINWDDADWVKSNIGDAIYVFDALNKQYATYVGGVGTNGGTKFIASSQGFWVKATGNNPILTASEGVKASNNTAFLRRAPTANVLRVEATDGEYTGDMVIRFHDDATEGFDPELDGQYLGGSHPVSVCTYKPDQTEWYAVNALPVEGDLDIPVWVIHSDERKTRTLRFKNLSSFDSDLSLELIDSYTGESMEITENLEYNYDFNGDWASNGGARFKIRKRFMGTVTAIHTESVLTNSGIYPNLITNGGPFKVWSNKAETGKITIINSSGDMMYQSEIQLGNNSLVHKNLVPGTYIVNITSENSNSSSKLIVR